MRMSAPTVALDLREELSRLRSPEPRAITSLRGL
jgi:hypothetical protein